MKETTAPSLKTVREIAQTGLMSEHALRVLLKQGKLPAIYIGAKALVNYDALLTRLKDLECADFGEGGNKNDSNR